MIGSHDDALLLAIPRGGHVRRRADQFWKEVTVPVQDTLANVCFLKYARRSTGRNGKGVHYLTHRRAQLTEGNEMRSSPLVESSHITHFAHS
mmetsp:Transcript_28139/g.110648  ORF Transcript_28139/g.110648 Transcript_28139/m.110648 type:complete len:92 (-) Transcript_28139:68-343(-)